MAKIDFSAGIDMLIGAIDSKHLLVLRQKHLHGLNGNITKKCRPEAYYQMNKRDYKNNPPKGAELENIRHFGEASKRTTQLMNALRKPQHATQQQLELLQDYKIRFNTQLNGPADAMAPTDNKGRKRHYARFDNFVRAMICQELKA